MPLDQTVVKEDVVHLHNGVLNSRKKNNNILKFLDKWVDLENIIVSEISEIQKDKYHNALLLIGF